MGCDGGVIASKRKFMRGCKTAEKEDGKNIKQSQLIRSKICAQTGEPLRMPIVACELGHLYNKEGIIQALLNKTLNPAFSHIRGLKDLKELNFSRNVEYDAANEVEANSQSMFVCPVTLTHFNGQQPFVFLWSTGYVLSEKAIREIGNVQLQAEFGPFEQEDCIRLLPLEDDLPQQLQQMHLRRSKSKKDKKESKKRIETSNEMVNIVDVGADVSEVSVAHVQKKVKKSIDITCPNSRVGKSESVDGPGVVGGGLSVANVTAKAITGIISRREESSSVFKNLFHKDNEAAKHDKDLFMTVAGLRYSIS